MPDIREVYQMVTQQKPKGFRNVGRDHAAHPYSWMRPPSTSRRRSVLARASRCTAFAWELGRPKRDPDAVAPRSSA